MNHDASRFYPRPSQARLEQGRPGASYRVFAAPLLRRLPGPAENPNLSLLREMRHICAANGEQRRLRLILACEQLMAGLQGLNPDQRSRQEARLLNELLRELGDCIEAP